MRRPDARELPAQTAAQWAGDSAADAELLPEEVAASRSAALIDVRTPLERKGELGFLPGSLSFPEEELRQGTERLRQEVALDRPLITLCLSGRRSLRLVPTLLASGFVHVSSLQGGLLAWIDAGLPVCGANAVRPEDTVVAADAGELRREIVSCFVAESVEAQLARGTATVDPLSVIERVFGQASAVPRDPERLRELLDRLADCARQLGHPLDHIALNVDRMRAAIARLQ